MNQFSSKKAYYLFSDVQQFFKYLRTTKFQKLVGTAPPEWPWKSTTVGIITNSDPRVSQILRSLGVDVLKHQKPKRREDISFVTTSYHVGVEKPDPQIFQAALNTFVRRPSSAEITVGELVKVHVGDDMEKDVFGSMDAGWNTILIDREQKYRDEWDAAGEKKKTLTVTANEREVTAINNLRGLEDLWTQK